MRSAHAVVVAFSGVATEVIKNLVLAGIGALTIIDAGHVTEQDLSASFFFRPEDVGAPRTAEPPLQRIRALNPNVDVRGVAHDGVLSRETLERMRPDVLIATAGTQAELEAWNTLCRELGALFYATSAQGLGGFVFSDLGPAHEYVAQRNEPGSAEKRSIKYRQTFVPLSESLRATWNKTHPGDGLLVRPVRRMAPGLWATWALWAWQACAAGQAPPADSAELARTLEAEAVALCAAKGVDAEQVFERQRVDRNALFVQFARVTFDNVVHGSVASFAPTAAILGGLLAQDALNALGRREEPIANWLVLDAAQGVAPVHAIGVAPAEEVK